MAMLSSLSKLRKKDSRHVSIIFDTRGFEGIEPIVEIIEE
jgi:hypothetical protein